MVITCRSTSLLTAYLSAHGTSSITSNSFALPNKTEMEGFLTFTVLYRDYDRRVYHLTSSAEIKVSWEQLIDCGRWIICNRLPLNGVMWYPGGSMKSSRLHHNICCILYHWIPAVLIDCLLFLLRYPPV